MKTNMKFLAMVFSILVYITSAAQEHPSPGGEKEGKKVEQLRNQFYQERLQLSEDQAQQFKPLMHEHQQKMKELRKNLKVGKEESQKFQDESSLKAHIQKQKQIKTAILEEEARFELACIPAIGAAKTAQLMGLDEEFKKEMKKRIQERKKEKGKNKPTNGKP